MKKVKRNAVILAVLLLVCTAVYLNRSYAKKELEAGTKTNDTTAETDTQMTEYFAAARLSRQTARDEASTALQTVATTEGIPQETIDAAAEEMMEIAKWTMKESEIETILKAKGFDDSVVFMSGDGVTVTVHFPSGSEDAESVAKITDIITTETDYEASALKIIGV